jgi:hypothetical protein
MPKHKIRTPEEISEAVQSHYNATEELRNRMDEDYALYRLEPFKGLELTDTDTEEGYAHYTSNEPQTFADKIITFTAESKTILKIAHEEQEEVQRKIDNQKERWVGGVLRQGDERQIRMMKPPVKEELASWASVRGWLFGRALLVKREDGSTFPDITPWDPLNTYWQMGDEGLEWACLKTMKTPNEIYAQYGTDLNDLESNLKDGEGLVVFDFYDNEINTVVLEDRVLKPPTPHGSPRIPVFYRPVGSLPLIQSENAEDTIRDWGESVFKATRVIYANYQQMLSIQLELARRSRKPPIAIESPDGTLSLEESPYVEGSELQLAQGEKVQALELLKSAPDLGPFLAQIAGEMQRGALPWSTFGELPFQLSGFAIQTLRQGIETILIPRLRAVENCLEQIIRLITDQYVEGGFDTFEVSGYDANRKYFRESISPEVINQGGDIIVRLVSQLPQDDIAKASLAKVLTDGTSPLTSKQWARENVLEMQDADLVIDQIKTEQAENLLPMTTLFTHGMAAEERGEEEIARIILAEINFLTIQKQLQLFQLQSAAQQVGLPSAQGQGEQGSQLGQGIDPRVAPPQTFGNGANPQDLSNPGPQVPPGTPRPGAQTDATRLQDIGLLGPGE